MSGVAPEHLPQARSLGDLVARAQGLASGGARGILGIAGAPGSGKSTLARALARALGEVAVVVPMDGFHLADVELERLGRRQRKGAPDTFDPHGYAALLRRLRAETSVTVYAPGFDREIEQPVAGSIPVLPDARLVLTEGNYLLLAEPAWQRARAEIDEVWFCEVDEGLRVDRLVARHERFGKEPAAARAWVHGVDQPNAALVAATRNRADLVVPATLLHQIADADGGVPSDRIAHPTRARAHSRPTGG